MKKKILLADDNMSFLQSAEGFLASDPDNEIVGHASTGFSAIEQTTALHPDVVLMDLKMPGINGLTATKIIKAGIGAPTVIIVTLYDNEEYRRAAKAVGADGYIVKSEFTSQVPEFLKRLPVLETPTGSTIA